MKEFALLLKPTGADCNLRCGYCFYLKKGSLYPKLSRHRMTERVLDRVVSSFMAVKQPGHSFAWQGGEPTLMGLDFFKRVVELQKRYGRGGVSVSNGLQTNGILIDDDWARHFAEYHFLLGVSLDGPAEFHNRYRQYVDGRGTHGDVLKGIEALKRHQVEFNILTLVSQANVKAPVDVYDYLVEQGFLYHQYIECVEFDGQGGLLPFSVSAGEWGEFLCALFDRWFVSDTRRVSIRLFDSILTRMVDGVANVCTLGADCRNYLVVEHNGDIYPCDFFVDPELRLGNILRDDWATFWSQDRFAAFGAAKARWNAQCEVCPYLSLCAGGCQKHRYALGRNPRALSALCEGWKLFYSHTLERFNQLAAGIRQERAQAEALTRSKVTAQIAAGGVNPGRNDPCPCGSRKKFKKCCGGPGR
jgi:uncharacterized protein